MCVCVCVCLQCVAKHCEQVKPGQVCSCIKWEPTGSRSRFVSGLWEDVRAVSQWPLLAWPKESEKKDLKLRRRVDSLLDVSFQLGQKK